MSAEHRTDQRVVGRYQLLGPIGRGGMAVVHRAWQVDLAREVALKELRLPPGYDEQSLSQRFTRESRLAGALAHPNIVTVLEYVEAPGGAQHPPGRFIAMELVTGGTLRSRVGHLSLAQIGGVLEGVLGALGAAAELGIVHRDLKPENIMVTRDGRVKVADFGVSTALDHALRGDLHTPTGSVHGTPAYMAPEQATGQEVTHQADLYALGAVAYELFAGTPPFGTTESPMALMLRHVNDPPIWLLAHRPDIDPRFAEWAHHLLAKDPQMRPPDARGAWELLEETLVEVLGPLWRRTALVGPPPPGEESDALPPSAARPAPGAPPWDPAQSGAAPPPGPPAPGGAPAPPGHGPPPGAGTAPERTPTEPGGADAGRASGRHQVAEGSDRMQGQTWFELGEMLLANGDRDGALTAYRRAARRGHPHAQERLRELGAA